MATQAVAVKTPGRSEALSSPEGMEYPGIDTNNSMPMPDKPYDPPTLPEEIHAYFYGLEVAAKMYRETFRPVRRNYVNIYFRVRRRNYEQLLWQLLSSKVLTKEKMYLPEYMPFWTIGIRMRLRDNFPMGMVMEAMRKRLGITSPGLRFCLDGFFGMVNYTDVFGNTTDACPWMEMSNFSTARSLRLKDGDSVFMSIASVGQIENVMNWRKKRSVEVPTIKPAAESSSSTGDNERHEDVENEEGIQMQWS